jgi:hypothetical protein
LGIFLCVDRTKERQSHPGGPLFQFVFEGPVLVPDDQRFALPPDEIAHAHFVAPDRVLLLAGLRVGKRVLAALAARAGCKGVYIEEGSQPSER